VLTSSEFNLFFLLLTVAGNETTRNAASGGMLALLEHPDQWRRLLADRDLIPTAAEEIVRVLLGALAQRMPDIELDGEVSRLRSNFLNGIKHMPVRFTSSAART
jgi:cytochrome P450